jgi:hypothetical protein
LFSALHVDLQQPNFPACSSSLNAQHTINVSLGKELASGILYYTLYCALLFLNMQGGWSNEYLMD